MKTIQKAIKKRWFFRNNVVNKSRTIGARNGDGYGKSEIVGYEPLVNDLKLLINKKQYHVLKMINAETINLYWEIGEEIYKQQEQNGWGKSIVQVLSKELQKEFPGAKGYSAANLWRMRNFYLTYRDSENSHHWCEKLAGAII